jgi:serine/threonine-protein kinase
MIRIKGNLKRLDDQEQYNELNNSIRGNIKVRDQEQDENILLGKYRLERVLSQGYTKEEYLTTNIEDDNLYVIRYIESDTDSYIGIEFMEDERKLKRLKHASLPKIKEIYNDERSVYIVQSYTEGVTLDSELKTKKFFSEKEVVGIAKQLCDVFEYIHNEKPHPIIYRYIKPSDIIITPDKKIAIVEFGVYEKIMGATARFAAPEFVKSGYSDIRTDIYSLGSVFIIYLQEQNLLVLKVHLKIQLINIYPETLKKYY